MNETSKRAALAALQAKLRPHWAEHVGKKFLALEYAERQGAAPEEYDEYYSEVCMGWCVASPAVSGVIATFAHGERGNDAYDEHIDGLSFWVVS